MEVFIVISTPVRGYPLGNPINIGCFSSVEAAEQEISSRKGEWAIEGWSPSETPIYRIEKHQLRST